MNNLTISKYRAEFWIRQSIQFFGGIFLILICIYISIKNGKIDYQNILFGLSCLATILFLLKIYEFIYTTYKEVKITSSSICLTYFMLKKEDTISYSEIIKITTKQIRTSVGARITDGFQEIEIELSNGKLITLNEDQFENFSEIKNSIYTYK